MRLEKALTAGILALVVGSSGCLGPDHAYGSIKQWNADLAEQEWVNEIVFLGLHVIPVYPLALFADIVIFNTIDFWSGDNPVNDPGPFTGFERSQ